MEETIHALRATACGPVPDPERLHRRGRRPRKGRPGLRHRRRGDRHARHLGHADRHGLDGSGGEILLCDFDGDGLDDAWALGTGDSGDLAIKVYLNEGGRFSDTAGFTDEFTFAATNFTFGCGDLGGSGRADLIAFKPDNAKLFVYPNTGGGFDQDNPVKTSTSFGAYTRWLVADYDGDGDDELGALSGGTLKVYQATERAITTSSPIINTSVLDDYEVTVLDLDADGLTDLAQYNGAAFLVWPGDGATFDQSRSWVFTVTGTGTPLGANLR